MADSKELKPKSFRIDEETSEKFKEIATSIGGSQQETLAKLIEAYEFQQGKAILTEKKADIEQFEKYVSCLVRMYMGVLEDSQNITELVRTEFEALLKSKDATIQNLQEQLTAAKQIKQEAVRQEEKCKAQNQELQQALDRLNEEYNSKMNDLQNMLTDKDSLNKALTSSCNDLKAQVEQMKADAEQNKVLHQKFEDLQIEYDNLSMFYNSLQKDFEKEQEKHEKEVAESKEHEKEVIERVKEQEQIKAEKALLEIEKVYQEQIKTLNEKYQNKLMEIWNKKTK